MKYSKIMVSAFGRPEVLKVFEDELRQPEPGEVLVKIYVASVARSDANQRSSDEFGHELPFSLGFDFAGKIEAVGDGAPPLKLGKPLLG